MLHLICLVRPWCYLLGNSLRGATNTDYIEASNT